jgi:soluble lytic murein transglycosylase-like protein
MRFCFSFVGVGLAAVALLSAATPQSVPAKLVSVVRADPSSGRLVRAVTVAPAARSKGARAAAVSEYVDRVAERYQVDPLLVHSVIQVESNYNPVAVSPKGARGLMQLMPQTARRLDVDNSFNILENLDGGVRYLKHLLTLFGDQDPRLALAAYNAGEGAVIRHGGIPPYPETAQYVRRVGKKYSEAKRARAKAHPLKPQPPEHLPIESFVDAQGRLHYRTKPAP